MHVCVCMFMCVCVCLSFDLSVSLSATAMSVILFISLCCNDREKAACGFSRLLEPCFFMNKLRSNYGLLLRPLMLLQQPLT